MPTTRRTRTVQAAPEAVWRVVGDPSHLPRWWPKVQRVESVTGSDFTAVYGTSKGRPVRADYRVTASDAPRHRRWEQIVEGSPFERFISAFATVADVEPRDGGATITLTVEQKLRGMSRFGGFLARRGMRKQLDQALDGLESVL
jgi:carbon monoxide dehydrogenase subunit G